MAPPQLHPSPLQQLVLLLAQSKRESLSFEQAWARAVRPGKRTVLQSTKDAPAGAVRWPSDSSDRSAWQAAIYEVKDGFRRAYVGRPATRRELALPKLVELLSELAGGDRHAGHVPLSRAA